MSCVYQNVPAVPTYESCVWNQSGKKKPDKCLILGWNLKLYDFDSFHSLCSRRSIAWSDFDVQMIFFVVFFLIYGCQTYLFFPINFIPFDEHQRDYGIENNKWKKRLSNFTNKNRNSIFTISNVLRILFLCNSRSYQYKLETNLIKRDRDENDLIILYKLF